MEQLATGQISRELTLTPAYGRDYRSKQAVLDDWNSNKDFYIANPEVRGSYINKSDAEVCGVSKVRIRYQRLTKILFIDILNN